MESKRLKKLKRERGLTFLLEYFAFLLMLLFAVLRPKSLYLMSDFSFLKICILVLIGFVLCVPIHNAIHEAGHLVCGLLTGYGFLIYRVGRFQFQKVGGKLSLKIMKVAGTGGQCLMSPPDLKDGHCQYKLYNMGGSIANILFAALAAVLAYFTGPGYWYEFLLFFTCLGIYWGMLNGIPFKTGMISNDGMNVRHIKNSPVGERCFWVQMKSCELKLKGVAELPAEWLELPSDADLNNDIVGYILCLRQALAMEAHDFYSARQSIDLILSDEYDMPGLYRGQAVNDKVFADVLAKGPDVDISALNQKEYKAFFRSMKTNISVLRTQYAAALIAEGDKKKAETVKALYEKVKKNYPYSQDVEAEDGLMALADLAAQTLSPEAYENHAVCADPDAKDSED